MLLLAKTKNKNIKRENQCKLTINVNKNEGSPSMFIKVLLCDIYGLRCTEFDYKYKFNELTGSEF